MIEFKRRPQFMRHLSQEIALCLIGLLRSAAGFLQCLLGFFLHEDKTMMRNGLADLRGDGFHQFDVIGCPPARLVIPY